MNLTLAALLFAGTFAVFWPVAHYDFITLDDPAYVAKNPNVSNGLTAAGARWAFTTYGYGIWHPVTWLSHMLDCQLFGLKPGAHHLVNVFFHATNAVILFGVLQSMTGSRWRSWLVAALFAWHPLRVESVAWVAERKDVLSGFFFLTLLWTYSLYTSARKSHRPQAKWFYAATLGLFLLGLMSKPMLVTVPFVLLLLDAWPLGRVPGIAVQDSGANPLIPTAGQDIDTFARPSSVIPLLLEKLPMVLVAALVSWVTILAQDHAGALKDLARFPINQRVTNALVSVTRYLRDMFWPAKLNYFYPFDALSAAQVASAAGLLVVMTAASVWLMKRRSHWTMGWFWFLVMIFPVVGLVQVGTQARADRYTYLPMIGILILVVWTLAELRLPGRSKIIANGLLSAVILAGCVLTTRAQLVYWRDGITICERSIQIEPRDSRSYYNLACSLDQKGDKPRAIELLSAAVAISPDYEKAHNNLGCLLAERGDLVGAEPHFRTVVRLQPSHLGAQKNLATILTQQGRFAEALPHFEALRRPGQTDAGLERIIAELTARTVAQTNQPNLLQPKGAAVKP